MTVTPSIFSPQWPDCPLTLNTCYTYRTMTFDAPFPPTYPHHPYLFLRPTPLRSDEEIQLRSHTTQQSLNTIAPQDECIMHTLQTILFLGVTIQQAHTPPPRTSEQKVGYLAVKQEQLSYILVMPLLKYCKVPAELSETAWIKGILSQRHCNINTLCLVTYSVLLVFEVSLQCKSDFTQARWGKKVIFYFFLILANPWKDQRQ